MLNIFFENEEHFESTASFVVDVVASHYGRDLPKEDDVIFFSAQTW